MGTWGVGLYDSDTARDLRDDLKRIVRAPWDGEELKAWAVARYGALADEGDSSHTDLNLVLADQFWIFGIEHGETTSLALDIVARGIDLESKRALGMGEKDIARRAKVLSDLAVKWARPNDKPRSRRILITPEPFLFEVGACFVYPTSDGKPRNPYVSAKREESFNAAYPWEQNGWGAAIVLSRSHHFAVFARYVAGFLAVATASKPTVEDMCDASLRCFDDIRFVPAPGGGFRDESTPRPSVFALTTSRSHLARMRVEVVGRVAMDDVLVAADFDPDLSPIARFGVGQLAGHTSFGRTPEADGPIGRYLRA